MAAHKKPSQAKQAPAPVCLQCVSSLYVKVGDIHSAQPWIKWADASWSSLTS